MVQHSGRVSCFFRITKREICAILLVYYGTSVEEGKYAKQALVDMLSAKIEAGPENLQSMLPLLHQVVELRPSKLDLD